MLAAYIGASKAMGMFLDKGARVDTRNNAGMTPLLYSAEASCAECVQLLVARGADVLARDKEGRTALHWAAICTGSDQDRDFEGDPDLVQMLLRLGVDPKVKDRNGRTALDEAIAHKRTAIVPLLRSGVSLFLKTSTAATLASRSRPF